MMRKKETALAGAARNGIDYATNHTSERWQRVTQRSRCTVCGHGSYCRISPDGAIVGCMRVSGGAFRTAQTRLGDMYLHRVREDCSSSLRIVPPPDRKPRTVAALAPVDHRHTVYSAMLNSLTLSAEHARFATIDKKLSEETVTRNMYSTVPDAETITGTLSALASEYDLTGVPGIYRDRRSWRLIAREGELLIPVRDHRERIVALVRRTGRTPKYLYSSSVDRGGSCGTPLHFALPYLADMQGIVIITEGILKSDVIAELMHAAVIGIPGVSSFDDGFGRELRILLPAVDSVLVAYDADADSNKHVRAALLRLLRSLDAAEYDCDVLQWDASQGKGLDDVLADDLRGGGAA